MSDGKSKQVIPKKNIDFAVNMAAKKYFSLLLDDLSNEKRLLDHYLSNHVATGDAHHLLTSPSEYSRLLSHYFTPNSDSLASWMHSPYKRNEGYPDGLVHETLPNVFVRSKSEAIIYMSLIKHSIPFRYEASLLLGQSEIYPDFTIRHPKTGKYFYWEHFGRIEHAKYQCKTFSKLQLYTSHGIYPSLQLITTFETTEAPLTFEKVERIIEEYFL